MVAFLRECDQEFARSSTDGAEDRAIARVLLLERACRLLKQHLNRPGIGHPKYIERKRLNADEWEVRELVRMLEECNWNVTKTAKKNGMLRSDLQRRVRTHGITKPLSVTHKPSTPPSR